MRSLILSILLVSLAGCGSGGGSSNNLPPAVPTSSISGAAVDGLIAHGTIRIYDFSNGVKGGLLAETTTDDVGLYSTDLQAESGPVLIELTQGSYKEEATGKTVALGQGQVLTAMVNHVAGEDVTIAVTAYTHVAAALARHLITTGVTVVDAINTANNRITQWVGLSIIDTIPLDITQRSNVSASVTPGHFYGFLAGAISLWTSEHYPELANVQLNGCALYNVCSIDFIQTMYSDMLADGLLDGVGAGGNQMSFGATSLDVSVYRAELALAVLDISNLQSSSDYGNKTGLTSAQLLVRSRAYAASTDPLFAGIPPQSIDNPAISMDSHGNGDWIRAIPNVTGTVVDQIGPGQVVLTVDGNVIGSPASNFYAPSIAWNSTSYTDGPHTIGLTVTNGASLTASASVDVIVDNTKPTVLYTAVVEGDKCRVSGTISDYPGVLFNSIRVSPRTYTGMETLTQMSPFSQSMINQQNAVLNKELTVGVLADYQAIVTNNTFSVLLNVGPQTLTITDKAGNDTVLITGYLKAGYIYSTTFGSTTRIYTLSKTPQCGSL